LAGAPLELAAAGAAALDERAGILIAVRPGERALAVHLVVLELALVAVAVRPAQHPAPLAAVVDEAAGVGTAVRPVVDALAVHPVVQELALVAVPVGPDVDALAGAEAPVDLAVI